MNATAEISLQWQNPWLWEDRKATIKALRDVRDQQTLTSEDTTQQVLLDVNQKLRAFKELRLLVTGASDAKDARAETLRGT